MRDAPAADRAVGIDYYVSDTGGVGGRLRTAPDGFRVREIEAVDPEPLTADPAAYPHLIIRATLRNWDTNAFARELADRLGASRERVSWAGTKDKRAVTTQLFSVEGIGPDDLPQVSGTEIEPIGRFGRRLLFGDLVGNAFEVVVSDPPSPDRAPEITADLRSFGGGDPGVPNYFGHQRFGSIRPVTHEVGLLITRRDWEGAVLAYVGNPHRDEPEGTRAARSFVEETREWGAALDRFPGHLHHERAMLHSLAETDVEGPERFRAALEALPWNLQRLFVNAAQSYVFNRILSQRLARGLPFDRAVEGDMVCFAEEIGGMVVPDQDRRARAAGSRLAAVNRHVERGRAFVTAPLVGTGTELATGEPGAIERAVLGELGLSPGDFDLPGAFGSTGTRRAVLVKTGVDIERDPLRFSFSLPRGSYATVLLREYLKVPPTEL